jgi:dUTP pyrophosphatase
MIETQKRKEKVFISGDNMDLPAYGGDAGHDIHASEDLTIEPGETKMCPTGIKIAMPPGMVCILKERSGLASNGIAIGGGVIDSSYRGEVKVIMRNTTGRSVSVRKGDKVAQAIFLCVPSIDFIRSDSLPESERGEKGFGSSGRKSGNITRNPLPRRLNTINSDIPVWLNPRLRNVVGTTGCLNTRKRLDTDRSSLISM